MEESRGTRAFPSHPAAITGDQIGEDKTPQRHSRRATPNHAARGLQERSGAWYLISRSYTLKGPDITSPETGDRDSG
jgi:hypothetical protein